MPSRPSPLDRLALGAAALAAFAATTAHAAPAPAAAVAWYGAYLRDSRLVRLPDGRALNLYCMGSGGPTVVLEAGISESAYTWWPVQEKIARLTRVCAYDRAGYGQSPPAPGPRDTRAEVADLAALLKAAHVPGPYVLVGHSMGGLNMRLFASRHLGKVAGLVLIDPTVEYQIRDLEPAAPAIAANDRRSIKAVAACADVARTPKTAADCARPAPEGFSPEAAARYEAGFGLGYFQTLKAEIDAFIGPDSDQVAAARRPLGAMPLIVLTRGERSTGVPDSEAELEWTYINRGHDAAAQLSTAGANRVIKGAGHYIHQDRPEAVVDAVYEVVEAARRGRG